MGRQQENQYRVNVPTAGGESVAARLNWEACVCVLFVEDEPLILLTTAALLEDAGFRVMTANDGLHAVDLLKQYPRHFTALVTGFHMPFGMTVRTS